VEPSLDCLHKLMAYGYIDSKTTYEGKSDLLVDVVVATIASCFDPAQDDNVQLQIIKALLTAVTSCDIHLRSIRKAIRTCIDIHLISRNEINRKTAQATLNQMMNIIFQRMESKAPKVKQLSLPVLDELSKEDSGSSAELHEEKPTEEFIDEFVESILDEAAQQILEQQQYDLENEDFEEGMIDENGDQDPSTKHKRTESGSEIEQTTSSSPNSFDSRYQKDAFFMFKAFCKTTIGPIKK